MTRKDYELIARVIRAQVEDCISDELSDCDYTADEAQCQRIGLQVLTERLGAELIKDNPRFSAEKFNQAAGVGLTPSRLRKAA